MIRNPELARSSLRAARRSVPFQLYLPTLVERSSQLDTSGRPVRAYRINGERKAVRLTFRTSTNAYWGIQQTDWDDAPVFEGQNTKRKIKGREYELYFSGSRLHMVVLRDGEASYWVVNTLLDELSNETMLHIARGLTPMKPR